MAVDYLPETKYFPSPHTPGRVVWSKNDEKVVHGANFLLENSPVYIYLSMFAASFGHATLYK